MSALKCCPSGRDASVWSCHGNGTEDAQDTVRGPVRAASPRGATSRHTAPVLGAVTVPLSRQHRTELRGAGRTRIPALEERQSAGCHRWKKQPGHGARHGQWTGTGPGRESHQRRGRSRKGFRRHHPPLKYCAPLIICPHEVRIPCSIISPYPQLCICFYVEYFVPCKDDDLALLTW